MDDLNNSFLNIILKEEITNELLQIMYGDNPSFIENTNAAYILYKNNISLLRISGINYKQALVISYTKNLLDKIFNNSQFWDSMSAYLRKQPYKALPNNIDLISLKTEGEIEFLYRKNWLLEEKFPSYKIQDVETSQTKTAKISTIMGDLEIDLKRLTKPKQIQNTSSSQVQQYSYGYIVGLLSSEIFNDSFYKEILVKTTPPKDEVNLLIEEEQKDTSYFTKRIVLKRVTEDNIDTLNKLNNSILSKELKLLVKPDFISKTIQAILAFDFTEIGYKPILSINSYLN